MSWPSVWTTGGRISRSPPRCPRSPIPILLIIHGSFKGLAVINRHFLIPMLKSQLLRHTAIFDPAQAKKPEMAAMALTECSVAMASTVETVAWTATWVVMVAVVSTAELDKMETMVDMA